MRRMGIEALQEAIALFGPPEIINTDQSAQFRGAHKTRNITCESGVAP